MSDSYSLRSSITSPLSLVVQVCWHVPNHGSGRRQ